MSLTQQLNDLLYKAFTVDGNGNIALRMTLQTGTVQSWKDPVASLANLPPSGNTSGDVRMAMDTGILYRWNGTAWVQANAYTSGQGISISGQTVAIDLDANSGLQFISGKLALKADWTTTEVSSGTLRVKPGVFASLVHTHISSDITDWTTALNTWLATKTTENLTENTNLYFTQARVLATPLTGLSLATGTAIVATDTELVAFGKLQKQITDEITNRSNADATKENTITAGTTAQYWRGDKSWQTLNTTAVAEGTNLYFTDARSIASPLAGLSTATSTAVVSTDSILVGIGKLQGQLTAGVVHISGTETIIGTKTFTGGISAVQNSPTAQANIGVASDHSGITLMSFGTTAWNYGVILQGSNAIYSGTGRLSIVTEWTGWDIVFATNGAGNERMRIDTAGNVGIWITVPTAPLHLKVGGGQAIKLDSAGINKTIIEITPDGGYQRATAIRYKAFSQADGTGMNFTTYVDRDSAIVGVDTYQIWAYPMDSAGNNLAYSSIVKYNYDRATDTMAVDFPRTTSSFWVGGQNWMGGWTGWTPTLDGDSAVNVTYSYQSARYHAIGKRLRIVSTIQINNKGTTTGNVYINSPATLLWYDSQSIKVNGDWFSSAGVLKWRIVRYNWTLMLQNVGGYSRGWNQATWANIADGDIIQINDDLELA